MKKISLLALLSLVISCDDGDFNVPSFDFDGLQINNCGDIVLHKITSSSTESLILQLNEDNTEDIFFKTPVTEKEYIVSSISNSEHTMKYRIFKGTVDENYFCQEIPPAEPTVSEEWFGDGTLFVTNTITLDDNDGVPSEVEKVIDPGTGTWLDTDNDGYPNYIDTDDDDDGILTKEEDWFIDPNTGIPSHTGDPLTSDTDGDGIPNYIDANDDGDQLDSNLESETDTDQGSGIPDYLDKLAITPLDNPRSSPTNNYKQSYSMLFEFSTLTLTSETSTISYPDGYIYGTKTGEYDSSDFPEVAGE